MSYFFRLKNNESIELSALEVENGTYALIDSTNKCYLNFCIDPENLSWEVKKENGEILQDDNFDENITQIIRHVISSKQSGIEESLDDEHDRDPFNPDEISIDTKLITMETLMRRLQQGTITLNPDFQRNEVWNSERKSQLIESLLLKIPIPMFYAAHRNMCFLRDAETGGAWLSSARVVRCWVKSRNERNPYGQLLRKRTLARLPLTKRRKVGMTSNHHALYDLGYTRTTMALNKEKQDREVEQNSETTSQFGLQAATRLHEVGIASNRRSACCGEYVPGPCTHRPSHHESRGDPKSVV